jgi:hypothetical protein
VGAHRETELDKLATELLTDTNLLNSEIDWLTSADAKRAFFVAFATFPQKSLR